MSNKVQIEKLLNQLNRRAARGVVSQVSFRNASASEYLRNEFEKPPGEAGSFFASPLFESTFGWQQGESNLGELSGELISPQVINSLANPPEGLEDYEFPVDRYPYSHQLTAWKTLLSPEKKSLLVSSGTGSGKTECFLIPILQDLAQELEKGAGSQLEGVRALFLYPLNALINSQRERLKAWTSSFDGKMRFCLYNGETPNKPTKADVKRKTPEEVLDRVELRNSPPPILVTNSTMLEYMLVRNEDAPIIEKSNGSLRWIVLDEAHTYIGSQAAELSLLLRRVMLSFNVKSEDVRFVATSATIGGNDDKTVNSLQDFLADVAGVHRDQVVVVQGHREIPAIIEASEKGVLDYDAASQLQPSELFDILTAYLPALNIRKKLTSHPFVATDDDLIDQLGELWSGRNKTELWRLLDLMSYAENGNNSFLPLRMHLFQKTLDGIFACSNSECESLPASLKEGGWKFGSIYLSDRDFCTCGAPVQPIVTCSSCGEEHLLADETLDRSGTYRLEKPNLSSDDDEFIWDLEDTGDTDSEEDQTLEIDNPRFVLHKNPHQKSTAFRVKKKSRELCEEEFDVELFGQVSQTAECHNCHSKSQPSKDNFRLKRLGAPFFLGDTLPTLLEFSPKQGEGPSDGKRLLTFTDSRQGTARIAARLQQDADRNKVRSVLYHSVQNTDETPVNNGGDLQEKIDNARKEMQKNPALESIVKPLLEELIAQQKQSTETPASISWSEAANALSNSNDIKRYMYDSFKEISDGKISTDEFPDFCLMREFMRRPSRAYQSETLGLIEIFYPEIEKLENVPQSWRQLYSQKDNDQALSDWKNWLTIFVDMHLRGNTAVDFQDTWQKLMGAKVHKKYVVGPGDDRTTTIIKWPSAVRSTRSRVVRLLINGFMLNEGDKANLELIDSVLEDAWSDLRKTVLKNVGENRFLVDLKGKSAFRKISNAYKCPYSHRVVARTFRGQSPNTPGDAKEKIECMEVTFPDMPFANDTDENGRAKINEWLETNAALKTVRDSGVWPNRADRVAAAEPWFRIAEHSAQVENKDLQHYESLFKEGKLNVLSCSTTMEMGVDIGGMSVVVMNNVPPHPANYLQRAGRAGRRKEQTSVAYTLCKASAHSLQVFDNPKWPFTPGLIAPPQVSLDSDSIVQRHVNAYLFTMWMRKLGGNIKKLTTGWLMLEDDTTTSPMDRFVVWCNSVAQEENYSEMEKKLNTLTMKTGLQSKSAKLIASQTALEADKVYGEWSNEYKQLQAQYDEIVDGKKYNENLPSAKAIDISMSRMLKEYLLRDLANYGFLPGYGFPTNVVSFDQLTIDQLKRITTNAGREDNRLRYRNGPSRELAVALREYAPGAEVVLKGKVYRSAGLTLNWHKPSSADYTEIQNLFYHWDCKNCGDFGKTRHISHGCPSCGAKKEKIEFKEVIEPAGFAVDLFEEPHTDVNSPTYLPYEEANVSASGSDWIKLPNPLLGAKRYSDKGTVSHVSSGMYGNGYTLCLSCGRAEPQLQKDIPEAKVAERHMKLRGGKGDEGTSVCDGPENAYMIKHNLYLASSVKTSVFELQLKDPRENYDPVRSTTIAWTVGYALKNALTGYIGIDSNEVEVALRDVRFEDGKSGFSICLYDTATLGAGYVEKLQGQLMQLIRKAKEQLVCSAGCETVCFHCLLDNKTQHREKDLNRHEALEWIDAWLDDCNLPDELKYFGEESEAVVSSTAYDLELILRGDKSVDTIKFFFEFSYDDPCLLSDWKMFDPCMKYLENGIDVELILSQHALEEWRAYIGHQLNSALQLYPEKLRILQSTNENKIKADGKIAMIASAGELSQVWVGKNIDLSFSNWASSEQTLVKKRGRWINIKMPMRQLTHEDLAPVAMSNSISTRVSEELDGSLQEFGERFVKWLETTGLDLHQQIFVNQNHVAEISYSDRYLKSPLTVFLFSKLVAELGNGNKPDIQVETLSFGRDYGRNTLIFHNFIDSDARDRVLNSLLQNYANDVSINCHSSNHSIEHARTLTLTLSDGSLYEINFDQGMGCWRYNGYSNWDFYASLPEQISILRTDRNRVSMDSVGGTFINIRKLDS